jgi:ABC-type glycerol-3-phosphate transport system substrate-binding protein
VVVPTVVSNTRTILTVWIPPEISMASATGTEMFNDQIAAYQSAHPDLDIRVETKSSSGQGSILNYLRTGRNVAPAILPDLIAIPTYQLTTAATDTLIYPLNGYIDTDLLQDLYPAALELSLQNEQANGYTFALTNLPQLLYNTARITETLPSRWDDFIALPDQTFVFPAAGASGATLLLQLYLAEGGTLQNDAGQFALQETPLTAALTHIANGRNNGFILPQSSNIQSTDGAWQLLQSDAASIAQISSNQYLIARSAEAPFNFSAVPGPSRPLIPLVNGFAWAISTPDSAERALAADLLVYLVQSDNLAQWSQASNYLPARRSALVQWPQTDPYTGFIHNQLDQANPHPFAPGSNVMTVLSNAVFSVVSLSQTPQDAAEEAVNALEQ